ncbi:hypothetical protein TSUD_299830 [Trifolium subterraneum]|uniref:LysM domain-containing protein n=1 Tax=Trifolium subterraneum TaxID=3900 RepID=A0A2Z6PDP9_TRISU|nr:hypothetical protein TSUD_299830 [Trifolium subterraneum]
MSPSNGLHNGGGSGGGNGLSYIEHHVSKFDTLAGVAIKYGVEVADVKRMNGLATDLQMFALQTLRIPLPGRHPPSPVPDEPTKLRIPPKENRIRSKGGDIGDGGADKSDEKSVRRRQKADVDNGGTTPERLFKEGNNSNGSNGSSSTGKTFSMRPKSASRASLFSETESGWLDSIPVGLGESIFTDGLSGVRKSSSASSLREQEKYNSAATAWPTISKPIFDGLPIPITGRRSKTALD